MARRNSTSPNPSANPARRSFLDNLTSLPPRLFGRGGDDSGANDVALLQPHSSPSFNSGFPRSSTPPASSMSHGSLGYTGSPDLGAPAQRVTYSPPLLHPSLPYAGGGARTDLTDSSMSSRRSSFASDRPSKAELKPRPMSLSVNYVPAKFTRMHTQGEGSTAGGSGSSAGMRKRRKQGGGREAFADDAGRMGIVGMVDDDEGIEYKMARGGVRRKAGKRRGLRWNRFKAVLFGANTVIMLYGLVTLVAAILVWLNVFSDADVIRVGNRGELIVSTVAAALCTLTAIFGYSGIILNNRAFLAVYTLLLWVDLGFIAAPGYMTYKQRTFNLEGKLNQQWSRYLGTEGRLRIQDSLVCCGYFSPFIEATQSPLCYARSNLPGCKARYLHIERSVLGTWYTVAFSLVGAHVLIIIAALLCSNHVTYRFGKGLTPKRYRLDLRSMGVILDDYANQIAAQYGDDVAQQALTRSVSRGSGRPVPQGQDSLIGFSTPRRGSFNPTPLSKQDTGDNRSFRTSTTGYNSNQEQGETYGGAYAQPGPGGVRLVSQPQAGERMSVIGVGGQEEWYADAEEDRSELEGMQVSTGYGTEAGGQEHGGPGDRTSVGWAQ